MAKFKSKAEVMFEAKMKYAIENRDFDQVQNLFHLFGCYLELIAPIPDPEPESTEALEFVGGNEPTGIEEQQHFLSGSFAAFCIQTLHADPVTMKKLTAAELEAHGVTEHDR